MRNGARALAVSALLLAGCDGATSGAAFSVVDSAGIRVVSIETSAVLDTVRLAAAPAWSTESVGLDGAHYLSSATIHPADSGRVVVGESQGFVWLGDPSSGTWTSIATPGDGPAEIGRLFATRYHDGSIWAADRGRNRLLEFSLSGDLVSERQIRARFILSGDWAPARDGHVFWGPGPGWAPSDEVVQRADAPIVRLSEQGIDTLFSRPNREWFSMDGMTGGPFLRPYGHLTGADGVVWFGDSAEAEIFRWSDSITTIVRWTVPEWDARTVADSLIEKALGSLPAGEVPPEIANQIRAVPVSPNPLKFDGLVRRAEGGVVVGPRWATCCEELRRPAGAWLALSSDGTPDFLIILPTGFEPSFFATDHVLGVSRDELGREAIQRWDLAGR